MSEYTAEYFINSQRSKYQLTSMLLNHLSSVPLGARILEIGCGDLQVLKALREIRPDLEMTGIDIGDVPVDTDSADIHFIKSDFMDFHSEATFHLVLAIDVLEHLLVPQNLVKMASTYLNHEGSIYISAPATGKLLLLGDANFFSDYTHVRPFNMKSFSRLLQDQGLKVQAAQCDNSKGIRSLPRFLYYIARGVLTVDVGYLNAALAMVAGTAIEAIASK